MPLEEDVLDLGKRLEKLVSQGEADGSGAMELLNQLQSLPITLDVLQKTRIGMSVNVVRKASSKDDIQGLAKALIKSWKKLLDTQDKSKAKPANSLANSKPTDAMTTAEPTIQASLQQSNGDSRASQEKPKSISRTPSREGSAFPSYKGDTGVREKCREMLANSLSCEERSDADLDEIATSVEEAIYKEFKDTGSKYKNRVKSRVMNLRDKNNPNLKLCVIDGTISAARFAVMKPEELASEDLKKLREEFTQQAIKDHQLSVTGGTGTDQFKCGRCGKRNCTYNQVQTRSADEPMTTFVLCNECGKRWKFC